MAMSSAVDCPADDTNLSAVGEIRLIPDLSTMRRIPWYLTFFHKDSGQPLPLNLSKTFLTFYLTTYSICKMQ